MLPVVLGPGGVKGKGSWPLGWLSNQPFFFFLPLFFFPPFSFIFTLSLVKTKPSTRPLG